MKTNKPLIFNHIPKTAGSSLEKHLHLYLKESNIKYPAPYPKYISDSEVTDTYDLMLGIFNINYYVNLTILIDHQNQRMKYYDEDAFGWSAFTIPSNELWKYWINNVEDKSANKLIITHLCAIPSTDTDWSYRAKYSTIDDFLINKSYKNFHWMTMLRDPVERYISEFYFLLERETTAAMATGWFSMEKARVEQEQGKDVKVFESSAPPQNLLTVLWEEWSKKESPMIIENYLSEKSTLNSQTRWLIGKGWLADYEVTENDVDQLIDAMENVDYKVGITEEFDNSMCYFDKSFGMNLNKYEPYQSKKNDKKLEVSDDIRMEIREKHKWDYKLYNHFFNKFKEIFPEEDSWINRYEG